MSAAQDESDDSVDVDDCLRAIAEGASQQPSWLDAVQRLSADSSLEQRLAVYRTVRDSGWLSNEQGFYLVASVVEDAVDAEAAISLRDLDERIQALEREFGNAEGEPWTDQRAAEEYDELLDRYQEAWDVLLVQKFTAVGERVIAELYRNDQDSYSRRYAAGEEQFRAKLPVHATQSSDDLVSVASYVNLPSAELAKNLLESEGIHAALANVNVVLWQWEYSNATGGVSVEVRRGDAHHAQALLSDGRERNLGTRPSWICPSCSQRIAGEWDVCWRCGFSRDGAVDETPMVRTADIKRDDDPEAKQQQLLKILAVSTIGLFAIFSLAGMSPRNALVIAGFVGSLIYLMAPVALYAPRRKNDLRTDDDPPPIDSAGGSAHAGSQTKSEVSKAIVRRAWQAAVLGAFGFPPLGFYSFRLLWKLAGRNTPLGTADRWRVTLAYILSVIAVLYCLLFVAAVAYLFVAAVAYLFVAIVNRPY